ncbi:MAG: NAD(P)H-binding protein, partial [Phycisphaeraceae bacterium]|nr:NAD(P)H-binding protein [Phycisphaeraceae bacterium]
MSEDDPAPPLVLLTGATGYVGGRLRARLEQRDVRLRCLSRDPERLAPRVDDATETVAGDVLDRESLTSALEGVDIAYYLVHSMGAKGGFEERDRIGAENFLAAATEAGVKRIIYLGGLGRPEGNEKLSPHLASRQEVGRILRSGSVETLELRASIIIGSGSLSFEMIRALVKKLPVMITPRWTRSLAQPIAIDDVLAYLIACIDLPAGSSRVYDIGGPDQVSYRDLMREY